MKTINPVLGVQIIKQHEILIMKNPKIWDSWMRNMLCQYHDLTIAGRDLIRDLGKYSVFGRLVMNIDRDLILAKINNIQMGDAFFSLYQNSFISEELSKNLIKMVGLGISLCTNIKN
jgi:hypothetical protein